MSRGYRVLPYEAGSELTVTQDEGETEEEEGDRILKEVLDEIGVSVEQSVRLARAEASLTLAAVRSALFVRRDGSAAQVRSRRSRRWRRCERTASREWRWRTRSGERL